MSLNALREFRTCGDPVLVTMANAAAEYAANVKAGSAGWLTFVGSSGTGKTYLAGMLTHYLGGTVKPWPRFMAKMRSGQYNIFESVQDVAATRGVLMLDEIGIGNDNRDFGLDLLMQVLEMRRQRNTVITSNLTLPKLAEIDARISSRLLRNGRVIACDTLDYALRNHNHVAIAN